MIWSGVSGAFFVGCHCAAMVGCRSAKECPGAGVRRVSARCFAAQARHPAFEGAVCHSRPQAGHSHQNFLLVFGFKSWSVRSPFRSGCHIRRSSGRKSARDCPGRGVLRFVPRALAAQAGQPVPSLVRCFGLVDQPWPHSAQIQCADSLLPGFAQSGLRSPFFVGSHSRAISGNKVDRLRDRSCWMNLSAAAVPHGLRSSR